jgi:hypothetical protein
MKKLRLKLMKSLRRRKNKRKLTSRKSWIRPMKKTKRKQKALMLMSMVLTMK